MTLNFTEFYKATNPSKTLDLTQPEDEKLYIDFSSVRGGALIEQLKAQITLFSEDQPTCQLFTGHIGCGKSTELSRLKAELLAEDFHVVYFESDQDLEMNDVDVGDILLVIARQVSESLEASQVNLQLKGFKAFLQDITNLLDSDVTGVEVKIPKVGGIGVKEKQGEYSLSVGIGKITTRAKNSPTLRNRLRDYIEPRTKTIIDVINTELIEPAIAQLQHQGKRGLVVIVDNLDRVEIVPKPWGRPQPEYLFVDRGEQLRQLNCHVIYTMPLGLRFCNDIVRLTNRFGVEPKVLPMVPVTQRNGKECEEGMARLRAMVMARAFPKLASAQRLQKIPEVFDAPETLDRLCSISGGHVRELLAMIRDWIMVEGKLPLSRAGLDQVIRSRCNKIRLAIDEKEWELLRQVHQSQEVSGDDHYRVLVRSLFVYEYYDAQGSWFTVNPILVETGKL
ncbi:MULTISPECIES: ATP-binding protein [unclassified Moorena]|uniref:ATP-binding protein n=1 Tax=unclassified Moorena TaxID=2683338 RepID=UPI0013CB995D|nr:MULTISPECIES: ATP-binding protein [unclassified Moorena]NEP36106.1 ATP-binding protein [Moorena sp. SIO3B2]NEP69764.1 ATP-binding protein [Moorena sp. SIO3A5]